MHDDKTAMNYESGLLDKYVRRYEQDTEYLAEVMALGVMEEAVRIMEAQGITRAQLAQRIGVSRAHVSRLFNAPPNLTLASIARLAIALGMRSHVSFESAPHKQEGKTTAAVGCPHAIPACIVG